MIDKTISHYKILDKLGEGGMGVVYKALDTKLERTVAIKVLRPEAMSDPAAKERFIREAKAASALNHPNITTIHEIGEWHGRDFICMEYIDGQTVKQKIKSGELPLDEVLSIAAQTAEALREVHEHDITHRDIKSENIMVTAKGQVKVMDFGLAKLKGAGTLTKKGSTMGTIAYMSPEQARGEDVDHRTDIWSLGVVLYEMLTGHLPFKGEYEQAIIYSIINEVPAPLRDFRKDIPSHIVKILKRALEKQPEARFQTMSNLVEEIETYFATAQAPLTKAMILRTLIKTRRRLKLVIPMVLVLISVLCFLFWFRIRSQKINWATHQALPEINQLLNDCKFTSAFKLAQQAIQYIPNNHELQDLLRTISRTLVFNTDPPQADIFIKDYDAPENEWEYLGKSPIHKKISIEIQRWRLVKSNFVPIEGAVPSGYINPDSSIRMVIKLLEQNAVPTDMVVVNSFMAFPIETPDSADPSPVKLDDFFIDRYEVTNKQFKVFVDSGGYRNRNYWKQEFIKDEKRLSWEEAMALFIDTVGRPGPASWEIGTYTVGQDDYPVTGISWYEAAAYAEFVGKSLPTYYHWVQAARTNLSKNIVPMSNFAGKGLAPVGSYRGVSPCGAYDMAGNAREWCWNKELNGKERIILGGAWNEPTYMFWSWDIVSPFDRASLHGFRCVKYASNEPLPEAVTAPILAHIKQDFIAAKPVSDDIFQVLKSFYAYDKAKLDSVIDFQDESFNDWLEEQVSFNAAYNNERMSALLLLPKNTKPPFQTVIFFPGAEAQRLASIKDYPRWILSLFLRSGRAVVLPIYAGTMERHASMISGSTLISERDNTIHVFKDLARTIDYLETRPEFDRNKLAYFGLSWGAALGAIIPAIEPRLAVAILFSGGLYDSRSLPEADQVNFAPRVKIPILMLNGLYDDGFQYTSSQKQLYDLLGTPEKDKRHILYKTGHSVWRTGEWIKDTLDWLDHYLGPIK